MTKDERPYQVTLSYRVNRKLRIGVASRFLVDIGGDHRRTIFIAGTGRSGTTWLSDLINHRNHYRQIFEPFHPHGPFGSVFPRHLYLRPQDRDVARLDVATQVLSGRIRGPVIDRFNKRLFASQRIVKDIYSSLFLKWLRDQFPGTRIVLILRHPCAVYRSQAKIDWQDRLASILEQEALVDDHLKPFMRSLTRLESQLEQYVAAWCIQTYVALRQLKRDDVHVVFYELLCTEPALEIGRLMAYLGEPFDERILKAMKVASLMAFPHSAIFSGRGIVDSWRIEMTAAEVNRVLELVEMFGLDAIYTGDPIPDPAGLSSLMAVATAARIPDRAVSSTRSS